jgi:hypothetical protein
VIIKYELLEICMIKVLKPFRKGNVVCHLVLFIILLYLNSNL